MEESQATGSPPPVPRQKESSKTERCVDCSTDFESRFILPPIGTVGFWTHELRDGRCEKCDALFRKAVVDQKLERDRREKENRRKREIINIVGGIEPYEHYTFARFRFEEQPMAFAAALDFKPERDNLFFYGKNGLGKTHLVTAVARRFLEEGVGVISYEFPNLVDILRIHEKNCDFDAVRKLTKKIIDAPLVILDELGMDGTPFVIKILWQILTGRINEGRNGLLMTSNLTLDDLKIPYGGKIPHRIHRLCGEANEIRFLPRGLAHK